jgi:hypothetical protein
MIGIASETMQLLSNADSTTLVSLCSYTNAFIIRAVFETILNAALKNDPGPRITTHGLVKSANSDFDGIAGVI